MARQLVFTSVPQGITPGRTGFCTVARHADLRERLVPLLEGVSVYPPGWQPAPVICVFRLLEVAGARVPVLSRIVDAGHDYTHRTNFLAHHLVLEAGEIAGAPTPAEIFARWPGWLNRWEGPPRWLGDKELVDLRAVTTAPALPAATWQKLTGDAGRAALLVDSARAALRVLRCAPGREDDVLALVRESSALVEPAEAWRAEFTTCLQPTDNPAAFKWIGLRADSPSDVPSSRPGLVLDLTTPKALPAAPVNTAARRAREGMAGNPLAPLAGAAARTAAPPPQQVWRAPARTPTAATAANADSRQTQLLFVVITAAVLLCLGLGAMLWNHFRAPASSTVESSSTPPPAYSASTSVPNPPALASPSAATTALAVAQNEVLDEITHLADSGQYLQALAHWHDLEAQAPELARDHLSLLNLRLLPGAVGDWRNQLGQISARLDAVAADAAARQTLSAQLAALRTFPDDWPTPDSPALKTAWNELSSQLNLLGQLPDAPAYLTDALSRTGAGQDYQDYAGVLNLRDVNRMLRERRARMQVWCAPAATLKLPPPTQWFQFDIRPGDYSRGDYLVLHDASRGGAGGRFLQLLVEAPDQVRLTWRQFSPTSDFFAKFPGNAPLRGLADAFWLHFVSPAPLPSFYLLVRREVEDAPAWKPLRLPQGWLASSDAPARVTLPVWLAQCLPLHAPDAQSFWLLPATPPEAAAVAFAQRASTPAGNPADADYEAAWFVADLQDKVRGLTDDLAHAEQQLADLQKLAGQAPPNQQPTPAGLDLAGQNVTKLQAQIAQYQAAAQTAALPDWPRSAAPWTLAYGSSSANLFPLLEFSPDATGPTP
jgi:GTPase-associated protein 1, N-terminal domain type 2